MTRARRVVKYAATGIVAGIAAYASYSHMRDLALTHGQTESVAALLPISVDGMLIVATVAMREDRGNGVPVRPWAWAAFVLGVVASVVANVLAADANATARVISAWPAVALLLVVEVLTSGRARESEPSPVPETMPAGQAEVVETDVMTPAEPVKAVKRAPAAVKVAKVRAQHPAAPQEEVAKRAGVSVRTVARHWTATTPDHLRDAAQKVNGSEVPALIGEDD